ncbi:DMT family transporter [Pseudooceanicola sp.]|uniref:DMT family transporter n=1 Tax=Pseudooceanicola sp. TaxID=1914328 RepID=UPI002636FFB8|nr:DMT family transporter [Pseudooceanicola sp.]MDF1855157.1 DMT family transporter [Pseudooceanicola sp.]
MGDGRGRDYALLCLLATLWGSSYLFQRIAVPEIPPLTLVAGRVTGGALLLLAVMAARGVRLPRGRRIWALLAVQSVLNASGAWVLLAWGLQFVPSALATVLNSTSPLWVFVFILLITRARGASRAHLAGTITGLAGVVLIVGPAALHGLGAEVLGQIACVLGTMIYALATFWGRRFAGVPPLAVASGTMICAALTLWPLAFVFEAPLRLSPAPLALGAWAMLALFCTGIALLIYFHLLTRLGPLGVASQAYLRQAVGVGLGMLVLGERPDTMVFAGVALAVVGVILVNRPLPPAPRA